jgi:hypothetical protein
MSGFAENQLKKYGWTKGQGLGKNAEGRKTPIIITKKNDTRGVSFELCSQRASYVCFKN